MPARGQSSSISHIQNLRILKPNVFLMKSTTQDLTRDEKNPSHISYILQGSSFWQFWNKGLIVHCFFSTSPTILSSGLWNHLGPLQQRKLAMHRSYFLDQWLASSRSGTLTLLSPLSVEGTGVEDKIGWILVSLLNLHKWELQSEVQLFFTRQGRRPTPMNPHPLQVWTLEQREGIW